MKSIRTLWPYFVRYRWRFFWGVLFVFFANFLAVQIPVYVGEGINQITARANLGRELAFLGFFIVTIAALSGAFRYLMRRILIDTSRDIEFDFRNDIYSHLQRLDRTFYDRNATGDIMSRMTNDIDAMRMMLGPAILYSANTIFTLPLVLINMMRLDWWVALLGLAPLALLPAAVKVFSAAMHRRFRAQQDQMGELTTLAQETFSGMRVVKAYGQEDANLARFARENQVYIDKSLRLATMQALFFPTIRLIGGIGLLVILYTGAVEIIAGRMEYGALVSLVLLFGMLVWPLIAAGWVINIFQRAAAAMERINEILTAQPRVADSATVVAAEQLPDRLDIEVRDLTFAYEGVAEPVLRNISLKIPAGNTLGIIGRIGSGKSTLVHLLLRMYPVERGRIFIGGVDINDWPLEELRRRMGIVFQENFLFSESIADNIRFGALKELSEEEIRQAARLADVDKDIAEFPKGYDTMLGERGINLSGGQKQRVCMARAFVRDPDVLILDDTLSAVDTHTEDAILESLRGIMEGRTTVLISHRISTVALADEIIVLEDGTITARGRHEELLARPGLYADLYRKQLLEEEVEAAG
jgi:ATP-binding cassette subfamily B multidrug efflux pump